MTWTSEPPAVPGWWFYRGDKSGPCVALLKLAEGELVLFTHNGDEFALSEVLRLSPDVRWAGPIPLPEPDPGPG